MTNVCPSCGAEQSQSLLCHDCTSAMVAMLAATPELIAQLEIAISKQARVGNGGKAGKGTAREKSPINWSAVQVRDDLEAQAAVWGSLGVDALRRDRNVARGVVDLGKAVKAAYRAIDRSADRQYLGRCLSTVTGEECQAELWARPGAKEVECRACGYVHNVADRRLDMIEMAKDVICTVKEASSYLGEIGGIKVTQSSIKGYLFRERLFYRPGTTMIRLGDLLELVTDESGRRSA